MEEITKTTSLKIRLFYSLEDNGYIAICEEIKGLSAYGETREKCLNEFIEVLSLWLDN